MEWYDYLIETGYIILYIAIAVLVLLTFVVLPIIVYQSFFSKRQDRNHLLKYFEPKDFDLKVEKLPITYKGHRLYGALYTKKPLKECKKLIIFCHGLGPGHCAYMTEIAYYCNKGYAVVGYDSYGCDRSEGKNIRSFYTGAECVIAAYIGVKSNEKLKDMPICLVGHSWGAYSALCATQKIKVDGVVAFSAFNSSVSLFFNLGIKKLNFIGYLMVPTFMLITALKNIGTGSKKAAKALKKSGTPALLIWGEKDSVVLKNNSVACLAEGDNIQKIILPDRAHNSYNTVAAEEKLGELTKALNEVTEGKLSGETAITYFANYDFVVATEEDKVVMNATVDFIDSL
jgi:pimeloyl-ACP methyl ester carboxylesterase